MIKAAWNKGKTASVVLSKVKEFTIEDYGSNFTERYELRGWYNKENYFVFGQFVTLPQAQKFLEEIHIKM
jgi:hypothetical protein